MGLLVNAVGKAYNRLMYAIASKLTPLPVLSLQTGLQVATIKRVILDPAELQAVAFACSTPKRNTPILALMIRDIRELAVDCVIIDSEDELTELSDIVRLQALMDSPFELDGITVDSDMGRRLGSVEDFTINVESSMVQKLYVKQSIIRSFFGSSLIIDRTQIVDVSPQKIIVREASLKAGVLSRKAVPDTNP